MTQYRPHPKGNPSLPGLASGHKCVHTLSRIDLQGQSYSSVRVSRQVFHQLPSRLDMDLTAPSLGLGTMLNNTSIIAMQSKHKA